MMYMISNIVNRGNHTMALDFDACCACLFHSFSSLFLCSCSFFEFLRVYVDFPSTSLFPHINKRTSTPTHRYGATAIMERMFRIFRIMCGIHIFRRKRMCVRNRVLFLLRACLFRDSLPLASPLSTHTRRGIEFIYAILSTAQL